MFSVRRLDWDLMLDTALCDRSQSYH